jgi:small subunit ribosomal protein S4e
MVKRHLKRLNAPKTWPILRKKNKWITRPLSGAHTLEQGYSIDTFLKELVNAASTTKEIKYLLTKKNILVNRRRVFEKRYNVGLFDTVSLEDINSHYRIIFDDKGRLNYVKISAEESKISPVKIINKTAIDGKKMQVNFSNGRNILVEVNDKDKFKTGDTLIIELPEIKIKEALKLEAGATIMLTGGKYKGKTGKIVEIKDANIIFENEANEKLLTSKKFAFAIGKEKSAITLK